MTRELLTYCVEHPDGKDTVEGIRRWWFPGEESTWGVDEVRNALESLTKRQWLISRTIRQSEEIYGLNKEKLKEIKNFLGLLGE